MKKLFVLFALLTCFMGAKAVEIVDLETDYSTATSWSHGWLSNEELIKFEDGCIHFKSEEASANFWDYQFQVFGVPSLDSDAQYTITLKIKGTVAQDLHASFSGSSTPGTIPVTTDWQEVVLEGCQDDPAAAYFASSGQLLIQCGDYVGEWWISYVKITHEGREQRPVTWQQWLTNDGKSIIPGVETESKYMGDAEFGAWPDWALEETDGINANWRTDRAPEICAWALTMGKNFDNQCPAEINSDSYRARPFPADIEAESGNESNHVFAVHVTEVADIEGGGEGSAAWSNQFWIQSPQSWKAGTKVRIKFRYKADVACTAQTQIHKKYPSNYLWYIGAGDVNFTTEWQEFEKTVDFSADQATGWSLAFNLNADEANGRVPNVFYFDDLSWETMVLDEGFFVASSNTTSGIEYDLDNAIEFQPSDEDGVLVATVGKAGNKDSWVNEIMISTVRGHDASFKSATLKPSGSYIGEDFWGDYTEGSNAKIKLPAAGVWTIYLAIEDRQINIIQEEGDEFAEPIDIVANPTEIVIDAVEREPTSSEEEGGTGNTWDNQFFLYSNRDLAPGEETVLEFEYKATQQAKSTAAVQGIVEGNTRYITGAFSMEDDDAFDTEWKSIKKEIQMPNKTWDGIAVDVVKYITFDLACIKEANTYTFKNIKWYLKGDANSDGKTQENLINATGTENFAIKIGAGTDPYQYGETAINGVVVNNKKSSAATYNLAGQRVAKTYKGIVVKDGKKYIAK